MLCLVPRMTHERHTPRAPGFDRPLRTQKAPVRLTLLVGAGRTSASGSRILIRPSPIPIHGGDLAVASFADRLQTIAEPDWQGNSRRFILPASRLCLEGARTMVRGVLTPYPPERPRLRVLPDDGTLRLISSRSLRDCGNGSTTCRNHVHRHCGLHQTFPLERSRCTSLATGTR